MKFWRVTYYCNKCVERHFEIVNKEILNALAPILLYEFGVKQVLIEDATAAEIADMEEQEPSVKK